MKRSTIDLWVGLFVAIGIAAVTFLSLKVANLTPQSSADTYTLVAEFDNIGGLKVNAPVKSSGVTTLMETTLYVMVCPAESIWKRSPRSAFMPNPLSLSNISRSANPV